MGEPEAPRTRAPSMDPGSGEVPGSRTVAKESDGEGSDNRPLAALLRSAEKKARTRYPWENYIGNKLLRSATYSEERRAWSGLEKT